MKHSRPRNLAAKDYATNHLSLDARTGAAKVLPVSLEKKGLRYKPPADATQRPGYPTSAIGTRKGNVIGL